MVAPTDRPALSGAGPSYAPGRTTEPKPVVRDERVADGTRGWSAMVSPVVAGRVMVVIAVAGILVGLVGTLLVRQLVADIGTGVDASLELTTGVLGTVDESFAVTEDALAILVEGTTEAGTAVAALGDSLTEGQAALDAATQLTGEDIADAVAAIEEALPAVQSAARTIDQTLGALSSLPLGLAYDPSAPLADTIGELREGLVGLPDELRDQAEQIEDTAASLGEATDSTVATAASLRELQVRLQEAQTLVGDYARQSDDARTLIDEQRGVLAASATRTQVVVVLFGLVFVLGQFVPLYLGLALLGGRPIGAPHPPAPQPVPAAQPTPAAQPGTPPAAPPPGAGP
jgi:methyl-accepting chemotaxis protein